MNSLTRAAVVGSIVSITMVDLKKDFDQYLLLKNDSKKPFQQILKKPLLNLNDWFQKDESINTDNSVCESQGCFPKMVSSQMKISSTMLFII